MNQDEVRSEMDAVIHYIDAETAITKDSSVAFKEFNRMYSSFDVDERVLANMVLAEWLSGSSARQRWGAMHLIGQFHIGELLIEVRGLVERLATTRGPIAGVTLETASALLKIETLRATYHIMRDADRNAAIRNMLDWVLSPHAWERFRAVDVVRDLRIVEALPTLRELLNRMDAGKDPLDFPGNYGRDAMMRLIEDLSGSEGSSS